MSFAQFARLGRKPVATRAWQLGERETSSGPGYPLLLEDLSIYPQVVAVAPSRARERTTRLVARLNIPISAPLDALAAAPVPEQQAVITLPRRVASRRTALAMLVVPVLAPIQPIAYPAASTETTVTVTRQIAYQQRYTVLGDLAVVDESPAFAKAIDLPTRREKRRVIQPLAFVEPVTDGVETRQPVAVELPTRQVKRRVVQPSVFVEPVTDGIETRQPFTLPLPTRREKLRIAQPTASVQPVTDSQDQTFGLTWDFSLVTARHAPRRPLPTMEFPQPDIAVADDPSVYPAGTSSLSVRIKPRRPQPTPVLAPHIEIPGAVNDSRFTVAYPITIAYQPRFIVLDAIAAPEVVYPTPETAAAVRIKLRRPLPSIQFVQPVADGVETRLPQALPLPTRREKQRVIQPTSTVMPVADGAGTNVIWAFQLTGRRPEPRPRLPELIDTQPDLVAPVDPALFPAVLRQPTYRSKQRVIQSSLTIQPVTDGIETVLPQVLSQPTYRPRLRVTQLTITVQPVSGATGTTVLVLTSLPEYTFSVALPEYTNTTSLPDYSLNTSIPLYTEQVELPNYTFFADRDR